MKISSIWPLIIDFWSVDQLSQSQSHNFIQQISHSSSCLATGPKSKILFILPWFKIINNPVVCLIRTKSVLNHLMMYLAVKTLNINK